MTVVRSTLLLSALILSLACSQLTEPSPGLGHAATASAPSPTPRAADAPIGTATENAVQDSAPPRPPSDHATQVRASHILIAYRGALRAPPSVTRTREEASALANHVDVQARAGADFAGLVKQYSDDPSAKNNHGDLGVFTRTQMVKPFADAAFGLMKQEIGVQPVETAFGFHIIKRTE